MEKKSKNVKKMLKNQIALLENFKHLFEDTVNMFNIFKVLAVYCF